MGTNLPAGNGSARLAGAATAAHLFWPKLLVAFVLLAAWIGLMVFGARYPRRAEAAAGPTVARVSAVDGRLTAKTYVVVRPARAAVPVTGQASDLPKPITQASPPVAVSNAQRPTAATYQHPQETQAAVGLDHRASYPEPYPQDAILSRDRREVGRDMMGADGMREGEVPIITMDYRRQLGWLGYVREMTRLGGIFLVFDKQTERILAQADFFSNNLLDTRKESLTGMSPRIREIHSEAAIDKMMDEARQKYGPSANTVILLLPLNVDFDIIGGIAKRLAEHSIDIKSVARVAGEYEESSTGLRLHVRQLAYRDENKAPMDFDIDLQ